MAALATLRTAYTSSGLVLVTGDFPADSCGPGLQRLSLYETRDAERSAEEWSFLLTLKACVTTHKTSVLWVQDKLSTVLHSEI